MWLPSIPVAPVMTLRFTSAAAFSERRKVQNAKHIHIRRFGKDGPPSTTGLHAEAP